MQFGNLKPRSFPELILCGPPPSDALKGSSLGLRLLSTSSQFFCALSWQFWPKILKIPRECSIAHLFSPSWSHMTAAESSVRLPPKRNDEWTTYENLIGPLHRWKKKHKMRDTQSWLGRPPIRSFAGPKSSDHMRIVNTGLAGWKIWLVKVCVYCNDPLIFADGTNDAICISTQSHQSAGQ